MTRSARLYAETTGRGRRLVLVHGFSQNRRCWGPVASDLARDHQVVCLDAPGHGRSASLAATLPVAAGLVGEQGGRATYLGYSMGGRLCLRLALDRPELVAALIVVGANPGIANDEARLQRRDDDLRLADRIERMGVEAFVDEWLKHPLFAGLSREQAQVAARLENSAAGLATSLRMMGTGSQEPLWDRLGELRMPLLVLAGERDQQFSGIGRRMAATAGAGARFAPVPGAGHAAHLEQPAELLRLVRDFLAEHGPEA